jgi:hypothetical protein
VSFNSISRMFTLVVFVIGLSASSHPSLYAQFGFRAVLNPKTYRSPSGAYALTIDPSDRNGAGPAAYRMTHNGKLVWGNELGFTLWEAQVTERGEVGGYAYSDGRESWRGVFRVILLDPGSDRSSASNYALKPWCYDTISLSG